MGTPKTKLEKTNARFINVLGEYIDFYVEDIQADFSVAGSTGQSRTLRQFFPHNMVQPSIVVSGTQPNSHQYNRLGAFIRVSQYLALAGLRLRDDNTPVRNATADGRNFIIQTVRLLISNGTKDVVVPSGRTIKGVHRPWRLEGYVKSMQAGAERFQQAPAYAFEFIIAESQSGIWQDHAVIGDQIRSWMQIFQSAGKNGFVRPGDTNTGGGDGGGGGNGGGGNNHHHHHGGGGIDPHWIGP